MRGFPLSAGTTFINGVDNPVAFRRTMRGTIVHEVKHIASYGAHIENPAATSFEESWLEEGMAMVAEEVWARGQDLSGRGRGKGQHDLPDDAVLRCPSDHSSLQRQTVRHVRSLRPTLHVPGPARNRLALRTCVGRRLRLLRRVVVLHQIPTSIVTRLPSRLTCVE